MVRWQRAHEAHAIERVCVTFRFPQDMPDKQWQKLLGSQTPKLQQEEFRFRGYAIGLPRYVIGPADIASAATRYFKCSRLTAVFFAVKALAKNYELQPSQLIYFTSRYISWNYFKERMISLLSSVFLHEEPLSVLNINIVKLEYWDRFVFNGEPK